MRVREDRHGERGLGMSEVKERVPAPRLGQLTTATSKNATVRNMCAEAH